MIGYCQRYSDCNGQRHRASCINEPYWVGAAGAAEHAVQTRGNIGWQLRA